MSLGKERAHAFFEPDEYTAINRRYFDQLRRSGSVRMDPSGWIDTLSDAAVLVRPLNRQLPRGRYYMDEGDALGEVRDDLHKLVESWEGVPRDPDGFTTCPSVGIASLLTLAVLRRRGVERIVIETPCYFAAILQAEWLGYEVILMPTYLREDYARPRAYERSDSVRSTVWWLTQPRITLGFNQEAGPLTQLAGGLGPRDYIVIDEALDQTYPSMLGAFPWGDVKARVLRLKGYGKPLGLNAYRIAFILHAPDFRAEMVDCLETFGGALDAHSLEAACAAAAAPDHFANMLRVANQQVRTNCATARNLVSGTRATVNLLVNGYIGSMVVDMSRLGSTHADARHRFLTACQSHGMPVILGPSMHFAIDHPRETVRLNFFGSRENLLRGVSLIADIAEGLT